MGRILVVDDEPDLVRFVKRALEVDGHQVVSAADGSQGLQLALSEKPDLVLLDLVMPGVDGQSMLQGLVAVRAQARIVVLSAIADIEARVAALDAGAIDFIPKPFSVRELLARVRRHLGTDPPAPRNMRASPGQTLTAGGMSLDLQTRQLQVDGRSISLSQREFLLMRHLLHHAGAVCSRQELLSEVWGYSFDPATNVVDVYIARLRHKLGPRGLIRTVRNVGYQVITAS